APRDPGYGHERDDEAPLGHQIHIHDCHESTVSCGPWLAGAGVTQRRHDAAMDEVLALRPVAEEDLPFLERLTQDPATAGEYAWAGWRNMLRFRQGWAEDRLVGGDGGVVVIAGGGERVGWVFRFW